MGEYYGVRREGDGPHLEHFGVPKGWKKPDAKYLARMVTSSGTYRYIYNQAQLAAAKAGKAISGAGRAASNTANSAYRAVRKTAQSVGRNVDRSLGLSARRKAQATAAAASRYSKPSRGNGDYRNQPNQRMGRIARDKAKRAQSAYDKTLLGRAEKAFNSGRKAAGNAVDNAGKQATSMYKKAGKAVNAQVENAQNYVNKKVKQGRKAVNEYKKFRALPENIKEEAAAADRAGEKKHFFGTTIFGKKVGKNVSVRGANTANKIWGVESAIRNAAGKARGAIDDARKGAQQLGNKAAKGARQLGKNAQGAFNEARRGAQQLSKKAGRAVDNVVGVSAKKNMKRQEGRYIRAIESDSYNDLPHNEERRRKTEQRRARIANAERAYSKSRRQYYNKTLMGRAEKAGEIGREAVGDAIDAVSNVVKRPKKKRRR